MPNSKFNVLYVDDEENNLISFRAAFRREYQVYTALSADEGINILHQEKVPIIITDQRMPGITGVQFLEKVIPEFPDTVRMILTGYSDIEAIIQAINTGRVFRYITKPWDETELKMTIDNAIALYQLQQNNKQLIQQLNQKVADQQRTLDMFQKYVPPEIVERVMSSKGESDIFEGEQREVSVLFCDIRGFTKISSKLAPREVVQLLNLFYRSVYALPGAITSLGGFFSGIFFGIFNTFIQRRFNFLNPFFGRITYFFSGILYSFTGLMCQYFKNICFSHISYLFKIFFK